MAADEEATPRSALELGAAILEFAKSLTPNRDVTGSALMNRRRS